MNIFPIAILGYLFVALEAALRQPLALGSTSIAPHFVIILVALVAMLGQGLGIYGVALALGLGVDLTCMRAAPGGATTAAMFGPHAVGFVAAAFAVVAVRGVLVRRSPLALPVMSVMAAALSSLVAAFLLMIRSWFDADWVMPILPRAGAELGSALYTAAPALALAPLFKRLHGVLGLDDGASRRFGR